MMFPAHDLANQNLAFRFKTFIHFSVKAETMQKRAMTWTLYTLVAILTTTGVVMVVLRLVSLAQGLMSDALPIATSLDDRDFVRYDLGFVQRPGLTLLHLIPGLIFVILGPLQFIARIRAKHIKLHRWCGRIYVAAAVFVGVTALIFGIVVGYGGLAETTAVTLFSLLFLIFLGLAVFRIRRREISAHREWMIRAFALGLAVTTMRPMIATMLALTNLSFSEILGIAFWLAFSLHLVVAELWVKFTRAKQTLAGARGTDQQAVSAEALRRAGG